MVATRNEVDGLLDRALTHSTAEKTEALYIAQDAALTRFATNQIHQNVREHDASLQVRVVDGERVGVASTNRLDEHVQFHARDLPLIFRKQDVNGLQL